MTSDVTLAVPVRAFIGEGPLWLPNEERLLFVDILAPSVIVADPTTGNFVSYPMPEVIGSIVPRQRGGFVAAMQSGFKEVDLLTGAVVDLASPESDRQGMRFNDGKCDAKGRFWAGTLAVNPQPGRGSLYRLGVDGDCECMDDGFHVSNGLGWSPEGRTFYFTDSGAKQIYAYDFDMERGSIANRRIFVQLPDGVGSPDGLTVDADGYVWSAHWDGWRVTRYDPEGAVDRVVHLPVPRPTSCAFGGPERSTLYVTSARIRLSTQQLVEAPMSGGVFAFQTDTRGLPENLYSG